MAAPKRQNTTALADHIAQAGAAHTKGNWAEAMKGYRAALRLTGPESRLLTLLGRAEESAGRIGAAKRTLMQAVTLMPHNGEAHCALAALLEKEGNYKEAKKHYEIAAKSAPDVVALNGYARMSQRLNFGAQGAGAYMASLRLEETSEALTGLGRYNLVEPGGDGQKALSLLTKALEKDPHNAPALGLLALYYAAQDDTPKALAYCTTALEADPQNKDVLACFCAVLLSLSGLRFHPSHKTALTRALASGAADGARLSHIWGGLLTLDPDFAPLISLARGSEYEGFAALFAAMETDFIPLLRCDFITVGLSECLITHPTLERLFTFLRRFYLHKVASGQNVSPAIPFLAALAQQCFFNEYVFALDAQEEAKAQILCEGNTKDPAAILIAAAYGPLIDIPNAVQILSRLRVPAVADVIKEQVHARQIERTSLPHIECLTPICDAISQAVQAQYEENPYPRWRHLTRQGASYEAAGWDAQRIKAGWRPKILVAGCGTARSGLDMAAEHGALDVLALDLSRASLAYGIRKAKEMNLTNIRFAQADILGLPQALAGQKFDKIVCSGVLHHMADPKSGLLAISSLLAPGGTMNLALYSEAARAGVVAIREEIQKKGWIPIPQDIRACRAWVQECALEGDRQMQALTTSRDFCSTSACRDLLFHVQEHRFTLPEIEHLIECAGLTFCGFILPSARVRLAYAGAYPDDKGAANLKNWAAFEAQNPSTFAGMYQMTLRKKKE